MHRVVVFKSIKRQASPFLTYSTAEERLRHHIDSSLRDAQSALDALLANGEALDAVERGARLLIEVFRSGGKVYACGNGGSMCDAMHFAEELTGRYRLDRAALGATAISDAGHLTCVGNDLGYEQVFSRYVEAHGRPGDCLVALSTSGTSRNVIRAVEAARSARMHTIVLTGRESETLRSLSSILICTPAGRFADRVQELHIKVLHIIIELVEREMFPANYAV